jgi:hypothetical protein
MYTVSIIVAEHGAEWLSWAHALRQRGNDSTIVLAQSSTEDDDTFAQRVSDRLRRLESKGTVVEHAAFVGSDRADNSARVQRSAILRRLSSLLAVEGRKAKLYLDAATRTGQRSLHLMRALGWAIADLSRGSGLSIRLGHGGELLAAGATI